MFALFALIYATITPFLLIKVRGSKISLRFCKSSFAKGFTEVLHKCRVATLQEHLYVLLL